MREDQNPPPRRERRALPGWAIDMIRDGVPTDELKERGQRAVWNELGRTALAAINAGYSRAEWEYEVVRPVSKLGLQNRLKADGKERTAQAANKSLNSAWARAEKCAAESPPWTRDSARQEAQRRATALLLVAADPDVALSDVQRDLLVYAADIAASQGSVSVNLPRAATARELGLGEKAVRIHLERLVDLGLLYLSERGRARTKTKPGKSNVYRLPDESSIGRAITSLSRETRQVGPSVEAGRPQQPQVAGPAPETRAHQRKGLPAAPRSEPRPHRRGAHDLGGPGQGRRAHPNATWLPGRDIQADDVRRLVRRGLEQLITKAMTPPAEH